MNKKPNITVALFVAFVSVFVAFGRQTDGSVLVEAGTVQKTVRNEPREIIHRIDRATGEITTEVSYETVTRIDTVPVSWVPLKVSTLTWKDLTNAVPSMVQAREEFKLAARASLTNTP